MPELDLVGIGLATFAGFLLSGAYYLVVAARLAEVSGVAAEEETRRWIYAVELIRTLVIVVVVAALVDLANIEGFAGGALLGAVLWIGFPLMLWVGAILHERTPLRLAAIHAVDWLIKLVVTAAIIAGI
ncbi:MAG TPA: DUF1761 domain-containing protein [Acidimicrobiia bacterium]|nr:DUF1761 domain-containing protein [Acidimicrobiia bacterium]